MDGQGNFRNVGCTKLLIWAMDQIHPALSTFHSNLNWKTYWIVPAVFCAVDALVHWIVIEPLCLSGGCRCSNGILTFDWIIGCFPFCLITYL